MEHDHVKTLEANFFLIKNLCGPVFLEGSTTTSLQPQLASSNDCSVLLFEDFQ